MLKRTLLSALFLSCVAFESAIADSLFDMSEMRDPRTLDIVTLQDWHIVPGAIETRQKLVDIRVGPLWEGQDLRIPVRFIVPVDRKAKGFHLTGGNQLNRLKEASTPKGIEISLIEGGIGLVKTIVQEPKAYGEAVLGDAMKQRFIETLDTRYSIQYWGWPAILMRAITAAESEIGHFSPGKIAVSGGSKNGASPSVALIADDRITALHASVSPLWESPLRLCDEEAWKALRNYNLQKGHTKPHVFLGGTFGPIYNEQALAAGHSWSDLQALANGLANSIFVSRNLNALEKRNVDLLFHPGTHDYVAFDLAWGGAHYPQIPTYLAVNSGHGYRNRPASAEKDEQNKAAFLLNHFFDGVDDLQTTPELLYRHDGDELRVSVKFPHGSKAESGRIWWAYDRGPDGSVSYIRDLFPEDQWKDMEYHPEGNEWTVTIALDPNASHVDLFSNHRKTLRYHSKRYSTYISSPYTRVRLK